MHRRRFLTLAPGALSLAGAPVHAQALRRPLARLGDTVPVIGLGTWITFDTEDLDEQMACREVLQRFFTAGGGMIDSSPMYGRAERLLGELLPALPQHRGRLVAATKVWTPLASLGPVQLRQSQEFWGVPRFDVLLVHNMLNWRAHLKLLRRWKDESRVRAIGISTSHGRGHDEAAQIIRNENLDVLQITYNLADTSAEPVMELAAQRGMVVVINRPFDGGALFGRTRRQPLPAWAREIDCANWAQFFLKWVVSHPSVTCAIPATRQPMHLDENMGAGRGQLPDAAMRRRMQSLFATL